MQFDVAEYMHVASLLSGFRTDLEEVIAKSPNAGSLLVSEELKEYFGMFLEKLRKDWEVMEMPVLKARLTDLKNQADHTDMTTGKLASELDELPRLMREEMVGKKFLRLTSGSADYYVDDPSSIFGENVCIAFPGLSDDMEEAAKCYALGRATACVFHLMRCLEAVTKALWNSVGAASTTSLRGWGDYRKELDVYFENKKNEPRPAGWKEKEPFYHEAHSHLTAVYRAWRNPTMHLEKTYTLERAKAIMDATKSLMAFVAAHVDEQGNYTA